MKDITGRDRLAGAVLAGGKASRLGGTIKGLLKLDDRVTIIEHTLATLSEAGLGEVVIVANQPEPYYYLERLVIPDLRQGIGPLGGIEAALRHYSGSHDATLFMPCDLPAITAGEIARLAEAFQKSTCGVVVAATNEFFWEPLCSVVHNAYADTVSRAIDRGKRTVRPVYKEIGVEEVRFDDPTPFLNINNTKDLAAWMAARDRKM